ncbi:glycosyltransferase family 39 protein [Isoptericola sp. b441]|uniref:Glycosyltransferase family 39 protein n=1 Tax=Actinotalea lenta TaxID=3064654 RepID=A0ABT9DFA5_9CELL|nr:MULTISPECIES: glycosyltransferase family 39 protein [unclassified Isoptericola]MDO8108417.1 glycosyltransferase family 39 protein [Isoptericola sp. b441]MDO8119835.1 glycosyltransferase family 39 protein [Isoptericola sp. b490]
MTAALGRAAGGAPVAAASAPRAPARAPWERWATAGLLVATAALYLWGLDRSGWANSFYAAAAQAGAASWKAFWYGASDAGASITVDKPPFSLWPMALSVRAFGLTPWSILVPEALMGVASVAALHASVRRVASAGAALLAGAVLAVTPVAVLMFRYDNPDAMLVLLLTLAAGAVLRGVEDGRTRWMLLAGALVGLAFLTKQLEAFLAVPAMGSAWLMAAPVPLRRRLRDGALAVLAVVAAAGWWVALVELVPASARPWIGGTSNNSFLDLTFGYNGVGRLTGNTIGRTHVVTAGAVGRILVGSTAVQFSWLVPAAVVLAAATWWLRRGAPRTDPVRAALVLWAGWLLVTGATFSVMHGVSHSYYTVALAPATAAMVGIGAGAVWRRRDRPWARALLAGVVALTGAWSVLLLTHSPAWNPWLRPLVAGLTALGAVGLLVPGRAGLGRMRQVLAARRSAPVRRAAVVVSLAAVLLGPVAYSLQTVGAVHTGSVPVAGPRADAGRAASAGFAASMLGRASGGPAGRLRAGGASGTRLRPGVAPGRRSGPGGVSPAVRDLLLRDSARYTWAGAAVSSPLAAWYQLGVRQAVMPVGGFNGTDPSPTLRQFRADVAAGRIHWFIGGGRIYGSQPSGTLEAQRIAAWVRATYPVQVVDGVRLYDLSPTR